jgi:hypothetical protein
MLLRVFHRWLERLVPTAEEARVRQRDELKLRKSETTHGSTHRLTDLKVPACWLH